MFTRVLFLLLSTFSLSKTSLLKVDNGVYSRVTIRIGHQEEPRDCAQFLARLESVLNETSFGLYALSLSRGYLSDIRVSLPSSWDGNRCQPSRSSTVRSSSERRFSKPDMRVDATEDLPLPVTEQYGTCGSKGYGIRISKDFFDFNFFQDSWELRRKGQTLLREWSKYRYGVFSERGFYGDPLYPETYADGNEDKPSEGCPEPEPFCPYNFSSYDKYAPTKQNTLCHGSSASEVILSHPDFQTKRRVWKMLENGTKIEDFVEDKETKLFMEPKFTYYIGESSRISVLLDRTSVMGINDRWTNIKRAFYRFIQYLPVGTELSIISFGAESVVDLPPTVVTDSNREGLHGRIPRKVLEEDHACLHCAFNDSFSSLQNYLGEPGNIILVTGSPTRPDRFDDIISFVKDVPLKVYPIVYPGTGHPDLTSLALYGKHYSIPEGSGDVDPLSLLSETLMDILKEAEGIQIQKVHETKHSRSLEVSGTFTMEKEILHKMAVTLSIDDEERVEFFEITNPSGKKHLFSKFEDGMVVFNHPGQAESGIWSYHAKLYPETDGLNKMSVDVVSQSNDADSEPFMLEAFSNTQGRQIDAYDSSPVILYARLTKGYNKPVLKALVVAKIYRPGNAEPVEVIMKDNGLGYPDITENDGIYSAYFSDFATVPGYYSVQVSANHNNGLAQTPKSLRIFDTRESDSGPFDNKINDPDSSYSCCGSIMKYSETVPATPFHRQTVGSGFYVKQGISARTDISPPSRVTDLSVEEYIEDSLYIKLKWSAPGGDYDRGKASKYEIRCYTSREALEGDSFRNKGILVHSSFTPKPLSYGHTQTCQVGIPWPNEKFYYALVAFDEAGNVSPISNVQSAFIYEAPTTTTASAEVVEYNAEYTAEGNLPFMESSGKGAYESSKKNRVYMITGVVVGLLFITLVIIAVILIRSRTKRTEYDGEDRDTYKTYEPSEMTKSNSENKAPNLTDWLDSLPRSEGCSPDTTAHDLSVDGTLVKRNHTLTKTNPYRHKVLTNGSFLNLKESCDDASNSSSRPTTSTTDPDSSSEHSDSSPHQRSAPPNSILKRSNTTANSAPIDSDTARAIIDTYTSSNPHHHPLFHRSPNYFSFRETPSTDIKVDPPNGFASSTDLQVRRASHKKKRTESVV